MTDDQDLILALQRDKAAAETRAAHLAWLLLVDHDGAAFQREVTKLADEEDQIFCAFVSGSAVQIAVEFARALPDEDVREYLTNLIAANTPDDARDLGGTS